MALVRNALIAGGAIAASIAAAGASNAAQRVVALTACPTAQEGVSGGCLEMTMHWDFARTDRAPFVSGRVTSSDGRIVRALKVRGRLGKGGVRAFEIAVSSSDGAGEDYIGEVAYLGRSREGRPIIVTDRGPLAFETRGLHVGRADGVVIIDERAGKVVHSYLGGLHRGVYVVRGPDDVGVVSMSGACLSPPESRPGVLTPVDRCGDRRPLPEGFAFSESLSGEISTAPDADLAMIRKLLPQTSDLSDAQLRVRIGRLGAHHLVVTPWSEAE